MSIIQSECEYCHEQKNLTNYYGTTLCPDCIEMEETTDWDAFEAEKRQRIAEQNEY